MSDQHTPTPDSAGWIEWKGGECPVSLTDRTDVRLRNGSGALMYGTMARDLDWGHDGASGDLDIIAYRLSDRLADERSEPAEPEPCFECGSTERIGTACKPCNPELDPSAIAGAIEKLEKWAARVERDGGWTIVEHLRTLLADHDRLEAENARLRELLEVTKDHLWEVSKENDKLKSRVACALTNREGQDNG